MATRFSSARHQAALGVPTGSRRWSQITVSRGGVSQVLEPISGSITQDARRAGRWDGRLTFVGDDLLPTRPGDLLTPFGSTVEIELGLELLDGSVSTVPYGRFQIVSAKGRALAGERVVDVGLIDLSDRVERYRFEEPLVVATGTDLGQVINVVVTSRIGVNPNVSNTGSTLGVRRVLGLDTGTGPWSELMDILAGFSRVAFYDRVGHIGVTTIVPDPDNSYALDALTSFSPDFDTRPPNVWVARGEDTDDTEPVQAVAMDEDPSSPTYAGTGPGTSPYGRVTQFFASPLIKTEAQAQSAANTLLGQSVGAGATQELVRPYDPTIDATDVVSFNGRTLVVDAVTLNLMGETVVQAREL